MDCLTCDGRCCKHHWIIRLEEDEKHLFEGHIIWGKFIWTDECPYFIDNKCSIHDKKPRKCTKYYCEDDERIWK
jgi:Fe-S-cluster containining protein